MMVTVNLTAEQVAKIHEEMDNKVEMMTPEEVMTLATKLNALIDIPFMPENREGKILYKIVRKFDQFLYQALPNEIYELIRESSDGISPEEADEIEQTLARRLNNTFNIPYLPESIEQQIFLKLVRIVVGYLKKGRSINN